MKDLSPLAITSAVLGFPARIGVITRMDGTVLRFAESDEAITVDGDAYAVVPGLAVSAIKHTANGEMPSCQIIGVHENGATFDSIDLDVGLYDGADVQIYTVDRMNLSRKGLVFTGIISNVSYDTDHLVTFDVKGASVTAKRLMTYRRAPMCRVDLYSTLCGVNQASFDVATTVVSIFDSFTFTVSGVSQPDGWFNQGVARTAGGIAFELANWVQSTQTITAYLPSNRMITVGEGLTLWPGCDKTLTMCRDKFANALNFQAEPHFLGTAAAAQQV